MEKNIFILLICVLSAISNSQILEQNPNLKSLRRLETLKEAILLGFDNYTYNPMNNNEIDLTFNIYFLLKYWNNTKINEYYYNFNRIEIESNVTTDKTQDKKIVKFDCDFDSDSLQDSFCPIRVDYPYCIIRFNCKNTSKLFPIKISIDTDLGNLIEVNDTKVTYESMSSKAIRKDITSVKNFIPTYYDIMKNASFVSKDINSFKIKGDFNKKEIYQSSNNIELITLVNGYPKKIPCIGTYKKEDPDDKAETYFIETKGQNNLANIELKYALVNFTKGEPRIGLLDFKEGENSTFIERTYVSQKKKGLSTGGIIAIIIPSCIVLLGVSALVFFLSRKTLSTQPIKNIGNNTIGVASSEAVVHQ